MAEPIRLWRGKEEVTVYGSSEANALVAKGWMVGPRPLDVEPVKAAEVLAGAAPVQPAQDAAPASEEKPVRKRAGEYGSGSQSAPDTRVDKAKQEEVKAERAEDKREREGR
jgi:hypothetical protein